MTYDLMMAKIHQRNMRGKVSCTFVALILLVATVSLMPGTAEAATYDGFEYTIRSDDTVEITGYVGPNDKVIIPDKIDNKVVTGIGDHAFEGTYWDLKSIALPDSITRIGNYAFAYCKLTTPMTIPDGVSSIGNYAFLYGPPLISVTLTDATNISDRAFAYTESLASVTITNATSIGEGAFMYCLSLTSVTLTNVTSIEFAAFADCSSLPSVTLTNVTSIGDYAFSDCSSLTSILFRGDAPAIGSLWAEGTTSDLTAYFIEGSSGFTKPQWGGKTSVAVSAPSAPAVVEADVGRGVVNLTWSAPSDDGGLADIWYEIFRKIEGDEATRLGSTYATTYADENASLGDTCSYYVETVNALLRSSHSDEVPVTPYMFLTIDVRTDPAKLDLGLKATISGEVTRTYDGEGVEGLRVVFAFSVDDGLTWTTIASSTTSPDGTFSVQWAPAATGDYVLRASWGGDDAYMSAEASTSVTVVPSDLDLEEINDRLVALSDLMNKTVANVSTALSLIGEVNSALSELSAAHDLTMERLDAMVNEIDSLMEDLTGLKARLSSTDANATALRTLLDSTIDDLDGTRAELTAAQADLEAVQVKHSSDNLTYLALGIVAIALGSIAIGLFAWMRKR